MHTKGPWKITGKPKGWIFVGSEAKQKIATIAVVDEGYGGECEANARLIVAAPKLLVTLQTLLDSMDYTQRNCRVNEMVGAVVPKELIKMAHEAIRKATSHADTLKGE